MSMSFVPTYVADAAVVRGAAATPPDLEFACTADATVTPAASTPDRKDPTP